MKIQNCIGTLQLQLLTNIILCYKEPLLILDITVRRGGI